jgi:FKBP-type peptidyl-prolyl cis-trans isomerase
LTFLSCKKDKTSGPVQQQSVIDDAAIQAYIKANNLNPTKDPSGLYYQVITDGHGSFPTDTSTITANYTGKLTNGTVFDSGTVSNQLLSSTIKGWQIGVPHINTGGRILLLIPSGLGYGSEGFGSIPPDAVLIFTIDLTGFH